MSGDQIILAQEAGQDDGNTAGETAKRLWGDFTGFLGKAKDKVEETVGNIDTEELGEKARDAAQTGMEVIRGESEHEGANRAADEATRWIPGAGLVREAAEALEESGIERKVIGDGGGEIDTDALLESGKDMVREAAPLVVPVPGIGEAGNEILNRTGLKEEAAERVLEAIEAGGTGDDNVIATDENPDVGKVEIIDDATNLGRRGLRWLRNLGRGGDHTVSEEK